MFMQFKDFMTQQYFGVKNSHLKIQDISNKQLDVHI